MHVAYYRLRTIAVVKYFTDEEVVSPKFRKTVGKAAAVMFPLVNCINESASSTIRSMYHTMALIARCSDHAYTR